jgi:hypothetical protein
MHKLFPSGESAWWLLLRQDACLVAVDWVGPTEHKLFSSGESAFMQCGVRGCMRPIGEPE